VFTRSAVWLSMARRSNTTRSGGLRGVTGPRTVSCGLSRRAVMPPTAMASKPARSQWTYSRAASPETQRELPAASAMRPSIDVASLRATKGRSSCSRANRKGALSAGAASATRPNETITPSAGATPAPPRASGSGSRTAATTRATPAATIASVQGGVLPWCAHGSRFTTRVAPRARAPAASSATTSACGPPYSAWWPSATTLSPASTTAPTRGFGATRPQPRRARSRARCIAARSGGRSEAESDAEPSEDMSRLGIETRELRDVALILARLQANLAHQLHDGEREAAVHEHEGTGVGGVDHDRPRRRRTVIEPDVRIVRLIAVHSDSGGEVQEDELPPRHRAITVTAQVHGEFELISGPGGRPQRAVAEPRNGAVHPADRDRRNGEAPLEHTDPRAVADPQRGVADVRGIRVHVEILDSCRQDQGGAQDVDREQAAAHSLEQAESAFDRRRGDDPVEAGRHRRLVGGRRVGECRLDPVHPRGEHEVPEPAQRAAGAEHWIAASHDHAGEGIERPHGVDRRVAGLRGARERDVVALRLLRGERRGAQHHDQY